MAGAENSLIDVVLVLNVGVFDSIGGGFILAETGRLRRAIWRIVGSRASGGYCSIHCVVRGFQWPSCEYFTKAMLTSFAWAH
jgi:hypothetical protein